MSKSKCGLMRILPRAGTICYVAPESLKDKCGTPSDVCARALGLVQIELYTGLIFFYLSVTAAYTVYKNRGPCLANGADRS